MKSVSPFVAILFCSVVSSAAHAVSSEEIRLLGFAEHQKNNKQFDKAREQGEKAYLEETEQWELGRNRDLQEYRKTKKSQAMADDGPEARADEVERKKYQENYDKVRREYVLEKSKDQALERSAKGLPTEAQELGLDQERPRYDYKKRAYFGAKPGKRVPSPSSGGGSGSGSVGGGNNNATPFPQPPAFDDFDNGYVPAPNISPEDFGDVPPPPPPPAPIPGTFDNGFGGEGVPAPPAPFPEESDF
ncbi:MAG: hypothetical protein ACM3MG_02690 [Bacillota bacterium]